MGESGSGKTTLTHLLTGLLVPDSGSITLDGRAIAAYPARERFRAVQLVLQDGKSALDPRVNVGRSIAEPMINLDVYKRQEKGNLTAAGTHEELLENSAAYRALWEASERSANWSVTAQGGVRA